MNIEAINQRIQTLETELAGLKAELTKPDKLEPFPQLGDKYYYITTKGNICSAVAIDSDTHIYVYQTKEEAKKELDIELAKQRLKHAIQTINNGWTPNWNDSDETKFFITFAINVDELGVSWGNISKVQPNWMYLSSSKTAEQILEQHKADLLLVLSE